MNEKVAEKLASMKEDVVRRFDDVKKSANKDLEINDDDLDESVIKTPKLHMKYNDILAEETINLKDLYSFKETVKLERWKYYQGKQSDKYYAENGIMHEKILKSDIDKYLAADEKLSLINDIITVQKTMVEYIERCIKEIQSRNFHCKVALDWRRFTSGA